MAAVAFVYSYLKYGVVQDEVTDRFVSLCGQTATGTALLAGYNQGQHLSDVLGEQGWSSALSSLQAAVTQTTALELFVCLRKEVDVCHFLDWTNEHHFPFSFFSPVSLGFFVFCFLF